MLRLEESFVYSGNKENVGQFMLSGMTLLCIINNQAPQNTKGTPQHSSLKGPLSIKRMVLREICRSDSCHYNRYAFIVEDELR